MLLQTTVVRRQSPSRADTFLFLLSVFSPFSYIGGSYCHSRDGRNELPKYLRAPVVRDRNPYQRTNPWQFFHIFHHSWEEIKVSVCKRLRRISRPACEIYVLIDLDRCFVHVYICKHADRWNARLNENSLRI